jgi:hypothetical protein
MHLTGLDLSRAWTMAGIATVLPDSDPPKALLQDSLHTHFDAGMAYVNIGYYQGEHWLATLAVYFVTVSF